MATCLLLRFDARRAHHPAPRHPPDAERAHLQLAVLRHVDGQRPLAPPFTGAIDQIEGLWRAALAGAGQRVALPDDRPRGLDLLASMLCDHFRSGLRRQAEYDAPAPARRLADELAVREPSVEAGDLGVDVLNAAWLARLHDWAGGAPESAALAERALPALQAATARGARAQVVT